MPMDSLSDQYGSIMTPAKPKQSPTAKFTAEQGYITGCLKDNQGITADWHSLQDIIAGVHIKEVKNVGKRSGGVLTELFRQDWNLDNGIISQVVQMILQPNEITGWHCHQQATDRIFVNGGSLRIVLYDARTVSPSFGLINEFIIGVERPTLIVIPPGIWHAVQNNTSDTASLINMIDIAYRYENPDHWRLPLDTDKIPFTFT
jgi:dTDP-4-dehydrorhamnose 3,5-epimerase